MPPPPAIPRTVALVAVFKGTCEYSAERRSFHIFPPFPVPLSQPDAVLNFAEGVSRHHRTSPATFSIDPRQTHSRGDEPCETVREPCPRFIQPRTYRPVTSRSCEPSFEPGKQLSPALCHVPCRDCRARASVSARTMPFHAVRPPNESRLPAVLRRPPPRKCQVLLMSRQNLGRGRFSGPFIYSSAGRSLLRCCSDRSDPFPLRSRAFCVCALLRSAARLAKRAPGRPLGSSACMHSALPWSALK